MYLLDWSEQVRQQFRREVLGDDLVAVVALRSLALWDLGNVLSALPLLRGRPEEVFRQDVAQEIKAGVQVTHGEEGAGRMGGGRGGAGGRGGGESSEQVVDTVAQHM